MDRADQRLEPDPNLLEQMTHEAAEHYESGKHLPRASVAIASDPTKHPRSVRLTAGEIVRVRSTARLLGVTESELLRRLITDGLDKMEAASQTSIDPAKAVEIVGKIYTALGVHPPGLSQPVGDELIRAKGRKPGRIGKSTA